MAKRIFCSLHSCHIIFGDHHGKEFGIGENEDQKNIYPFPVVAASLYGTFITAVGKHYIRQPYRSSRMCSYNYVLYPGQRMAVFSILHITHTVGSVYKLIGADVIIA